MQTNVGDQPILWPTLLGLLAWITGIAAVQPGWAGALFLLAPLAAVPLAMGNWSLKPQTRWLVVAGALFLIPAYGCERGPVAAGLTLPWLMVCTGLAMNKLRHWPRRRDTFSLLMCGYLAVGACWLFMARWGLRPLGFDDVIVHATAMHFHYAGFILPMLLVRLAQADRTRATCWALGGVLAGMPLVAAGITLTVWHVHWLESAATGFLAMACWLAAWRQARYAWSLTMPAAKAMLMVSSASLTVAMVLASAYALGQLVGTHWLDIPFMLRFHGGLQVLGFALPALLAWRMIDAGAISAHLVTTTAPQADSKAT